MKGGSKRLTLFRQNDTHPYLELHWEHFGRNGKPEYRRAGGYARASTIGRQSQAGSDGASLFVDCDDTIHGIGPARSAAIVPALHRMGLQSTPPGNWSSASPQRRDCMRCQQDQQVTARAVGPRREEVAPGLAGIGGERRLEQLPREAEQETADDEDHFGCEGSPR